MAFCPNCGTPNTEQAERCVACGFELIVPKQKAKFKGTIMMSGIKAPVKQPEPPAAPAPPPASAPPPPAAAPAREVSHKKTMLGQPPITLPAKPEPPPASPSMDLGSMPTMQGTTPSREASLPQASLPPPQASIPPAGGTTTLELQPDLASTTPTKPPRPQTPSATKAPSFQSGGSYGNTPSPTSSGSPKASVSFSSIGGGRTSMGGAYASTMPPAASPNPTKVIAIGCGIVLAIFLLVGGGLWLAFGDRLKALFGGENEADAAEAAAWHASIAQSLTKVNELCQSDCAQAGVFFHPLRQAALLGEARVLTPARLAKLNAPASSSTTMLDRTEDTAVATQLGLDPQQCARVISGDAKVISCSVPDPTGKPSVLRIVQLSGISAL